MNWFVSILGLGLILLAVILLLAFSLLQKFQARRGTRSRIKLRPMRAMQRLQRAIGLAVEDGTRLHVSLGNSGIVSLTNASALVGLSALEHIGSLSSISDRAPVATSGDGTLSILSQDTLRAAYRMSSIPEQFDPNQARLAGPTAFSYVAGTLPVIRDERVSANLLIGSFGPEVALLVEASNEEGAFTLAASDSIAAQAALYATTPDPLIGEELFAIPAYLKPESIYQSSVRVQDVLRWVVIVALIGGSALSFLGFL